MPYKEFNPTTFYWSRFCLFLQLLLFWWILEHFWQSVFFLYFFYLKLFNSFLLWKLHLKVCAKRQSDTSKSTRYIFIWCKICSFVSKVTLLTPSPFFYHNTRIWSSPNWCDLKSVQLYVLSYPFDSVKFYAIIFCHAWLILEWHYV